MWGHRARMAIHRPWRRCRGTQPCKHLNLSLAACRTGGSEFLWSKLVMPAWREPADAGTLLPLLPGLHPTQGLH